MEPVDCLAYIGRNPLDEDNVFIATGDSGMGMTHGTIAGMLLTDLILGRPNPWEKLYDPSPHAPEVGWRRSCKENLNVAKRIPRPGHAGRGEDGRRDRAGHRRGDPPRADEGRLLPRPTGKLHEYSADLPAPRVRRHVERAGEDVGLPVPRLAVRRRTARSSTVRRIRTCRQRRIEGRNSRATRKHLRFAALQADARMNNRWHGLDNSLLHRW